MRNYAFPVTKYVNCLIGIKAGKLLTLRVDPCLPCRYSVMAVGSVQLLYNTGWECYQLTAEQPLSRQMVQTVYHSTSNKSHLPGNPLRAKL